MKRIHTFFALCTASLLLAACAGEQPAPVKKTVAPVPSAQSQQSKATAAFSDLDDEIAGRGKSIEQEGMPTKQPPQQTVTEPQFKPKPGGTVGSAPRTTTKYPIVNGYPVWFNNPYLDGYLGGVGVAKPQTRGGIGVQKRVAVALAQAEIARAIKVVVDSTLTTEKTVVDTKVAQYYKSKMDLLSRQQAEEYLQNTSVMDEWLNPDTGELFVWVVLPK